MNENPVKEVMEDVLRIALEKKKNVISLPMLKEDVFVADELFIEAIDELEKEGLIHIENHRVILTGKGEEKAGKILDRHRTIEKYFGEILRDPRSHSAAHALEHFVADETIRRMRDFLNMKGRGKPAPDFPPGREILIIAVENADKRILEKIISLGLTPGSKVKIEEKIPNAVIFNIGGRKIALANKIAKNISAVTEDEEY